MKKINSSFCSIFVLLFCVFSLQSVNAGNDVPLKSDNDPVAGTNPRPSILSRTTSFATVINALSVNLNETELVVNFNRSVNIAHIYVEDQNGSVVYQDVVNTNESLESVIETSGWDSGNYTIHISYGSTKLSGTFQL